MTYKCFKCGTYLVNSYDKCTTCGTREAAERQADKITTAINDANRANERQAEAIAGALVEAARTQAAAAAAAAALNIRVANEQNISDADAFDKGYQLSFLSTNPTAFNECIDDTGQITELHYNNPYVLDRLKDSFNNGVWSRLRDEVGSDLIVTNAENIFIDKAYKEGREGHQLFKFELAVDFLINCKLTTRDFRFLFNFPYEYDNSTCEYKLGIDKCESPFKSKLVWDAYTRGIREYVQDLNHPTLVSKRKLELKKDKKITTALVVAAVLAVIALISLSYWFWTTGHTLYAILVVLAVIFCWKKQVIFALLGIFIVHGITKGFW